MSFFEGVKGLLQIDLFPTLLLSLGLLVVVGILLSLGRRLQSAMSLERLGIPIALLVGVLGFLIGPYGPFPLLPTEVLDIWIQLPTPLLTLVFASLMLGRPIPLVSDLWKPVASQALLGLLLGFGQYVVGGIVVIFILLPFLGVDPLMGCLIEVGFEGGHGAASIMGESFTKLGFNEGLDLGLAMATVGLLSSTLIGSGLVVFGRLKGWIDFKENYNQEEIYDQEPVNGLFDQVLILLVNLAFVGIAVFIGVILLQCLREISPYLGKIFDEVILVFPVFPLALIGSLITRFTLDKTGKSQIVSALLQREIGVLATDLLIITAMAGLNLPLLINNWLPITILSFAGLTWNLAGMLFFARLVFEKEWFERSIAEFGNSTGVAASGLLLLRLADPINRTNTLPVFSIKQLFLQPILSGGLITVAAPFFINSFGLNGWTEICAVITFIIFCSALYLRTLETKHDVL